MPAATDDPGTSGRKPVYVRTFCNAREHALVLLVQRRFDLDAGEIINVLDLWQQHGKEFMEWREAPPPPPPPPEPMAAPEPAVAPAAVAMAAVPVAAAVAASLPSPSPVAAAGWLAA